MSVELDRLKVRFDGLFNEDGLTNIKFFIDRRPEITGAEFASELNKIQDTIAAGGISPIESIDKDAKTRRFDEAF